MYMYMKEVLVAVISHMTLKSHIHPIHVYTYMYCKLTSTQAVLVYPRRQAHIFELITISVERLHELTYKLGEIQVFLVYFRLDTFGGRHTQGIYEYCVRKRYFVQSHL